MTESAEPLIRTVIIVNWRSNKSATRFGQVRPSCTRGQSWCPVAMRLYYTLRTRYLVMFSVKMCVKGALITFPGFEMVFFH